MNDIITLPRSVVERALEALFMYKPMVTGVTFQHGLDAMQELRAALDQPQDHPKQHLDMVPPSWKLVPVEPADSQIRAAQDTWWHACNCETYWDQIYAAMIAASPQPPVVEQPQVEQELDAFYEWWHMRPSLTRLQAWLLWKYEQKQFERAHGIGGEE